MGSGKPRGIRAGRKLATKRRLQKYFYLSIQDGTIKNIMLDCFVLDSRIPSMAAVWLKG
jgi:hypothetical protein